MNEFFTLDVASFLAAFGSNPFTAMYTFFIYGGWVVFLIILIWAGTKIWLNWRQTIAARSKEFITLAIDIPRLTEKDAGQSLKAVENIFSHLAGAHAPASWTETWIQGKHQDPISCEIISIEGNVQFIIYCLRPLRDLVEASIFAQYPEAEITEVDDYAKNVPTWYPDAEWDLWGTEMIPAGGKPSFYSLRTYPSFEHTMSSELKDPLAVLLEGMSRMGPGEQVWVQLLCLPIDIGTYQKEGSKVIKELKGEKVVNPPSMIEKIVLAPFNLFIWLANELMGGGGGGDAKADNPLQNKMLALSPGDKKVLEAVENKVSKLAFNCKIRFIYVGKKNVFKKPKIVQSLIGFIKQMNTNDMLSLKPEAKQVGVNGSLLFMKDKRNSVRKRKLIKYYQDRSIWDGNAPYYLCTEELATLWHFPHTYQVKAPQVKKREMKYTEPPMNLPFA
ncbi:hypothetical protein GF391_01530 [Candidatus Uhrbacteria bacterium]|nr:hypothetical protein [Candidatus Uhrbacteria bacterium]